MTDPEVNGDSAVRVYVPTDVRPEMLDGPEAQALRDELTATRAQLAALREFGTREQAGWDTASTTLTRKARRAEEACAVALARLAESKAETKQLYELAFGKDAPCEKCGGKDFRIDGEAILCTACGADLLACPACRATQARLAEEQTAHATLRALWDARCGTIASVQARLEAAERVVAAARALEAAVLYEAGAREKLHAPRAVLAASLTHRADVLAALDAAASSRAGDDS